MTRLFRVLPFCLLISFLMTLPSGAHSQCVIDTTYNNPGAYPTELPRGCEGSSYDETVQVVFPFDTIILNQILPYDSFQILQSWGAIAGLNYNCFNSPSCTVYPTGNTSPARSCLQVSGVPQNQSSSFDSIYIEVGYWVTIPFIGPNMIRDTLAVRLDVIGAPQAAFTYSVNGTTISFTNNSTQAGFFQWDFGDGIQASGLAPVHIYSNSGVYQVCLTALGDLGLCAPSTVCQMVNVLVSRDLEFSSVSHYPNPSEGRFFIQGVPLGATIEVSDTYGKLVWQSIAEQETILVELPESATSMYFVRLTSNGESKVFKAIVLER